ncbi:endonuclease-reverse transcriptase, partial [Aphelenchoides avenae]
RRPLKIVQVYAPHSGYDDETVEQFYEELTEQLADHACRTMVIGDFNARIGRQQNGEKYIGLNTADERNARGERMAAFAESHRLHVMTSYFEKPKNQRWTWHSPCFDQFNELDYILCDDRRSVSIVEVLSRLGCDSDHRPVRATLHLDVKRLKKSLALSSQKRASTFDKKTLLKRHIGP